MLTIKLVENNGHEQIHPDIQTVTADPNRGLGGGAMSVTAWRTAEDDHPIQFGSNGTVYVMNEHGSTISRYWLGHSEYPTTPLAETAAA